ncbi:Mu-like prophage major head subunit gpT family protein [Romboutsia sp.]|uniref:Mu-like prophage major head subunit gpT family protein n=1 Tax=Romboutsia sp. TaxID=1965302 RepID=UPI002BFF6520|nr:Mu-like prophage major head subunit gpT family protein [Romboutsia sp.]HSQ90152.1 Mu-like prophage major head subunit gpT family protein [Romboutsia sp.]
MIKVEKMNLQLFGTVTPVDPTTSNTHISDNFGKLLEPGLRKIFFETYQEIPEQFSKVFNVNTSSKAKEVDYGLGAFGDWTARATNLSPVDYKTLDPGLERVYTHKAFTQGFMIERELYDDEQYKQIQKFPKAMARSGRASVEKNAFTLFVDGFTTNGYDGKALFAVDHPLLNSANVGSNLVVGELSRDTLQTAIQMMREIPDEAGNLIQFKADKLLVPPALEDTARRILHSTLVSGGDLNDTNEYLTRQDIKIEVLDYLGSVAGGSDTAWFLQDSKRHELNFFWRKKFEFKWEEDFDTFVSKYRGYCRYSYGYSDWRGIIGSTGINPI